MAAIHILIQSADDLLQKRAMLAHLVESVDQWLGRWSLAA